MSKAAKTVPKYVEWTIEQAARAWGVSRARINKWRRQGRIAWRYHDRLHSRVVILQSTKPAAVEYGSLARFNRGATEYKATG